MRKPCSHASCPSPAAGFRRVRKISLGASGALATSVEPVWLCMTHLLEEPVGALPPRSGADALAN